MKIFSVLAVFLLSSVGFAVPHLIFNVAKKDRLSDTKIVGSAGKIAAAEFAFPMESFLGKSIEEVFSQFGPDTTSKAVALINDTLQGPEKDRELTYTSPFDSKQYVAHFIKMFDVDGASVNILIYPNQ